MEGDEVLSLDAGVVLLIDPDILPFFAQPSLITPAQLVSLTPCGFETLEFVGPELQGLVMEGIQYTKCSWKLSKITHEEDKQKKNKNQLMWLHLFCSELLFNICFAGNNCLILNMCKEEQSVHTLQGSD